MPSTFALSQLSLSLHGAITVPDVQHAYLSAINNLVSADAHGFVAFEELAEGSSPLRIMTRAAPDELASDYTRLGTRNDPLLRAALARNSPAGSGEMSREAWLSEPLYSMLSGHGLHQSMVVALRSGTQMTGALYLARSATEHSFVKHDLAAMVNAKEHVEMALYRAMLQESMQQQASLLGWILDQVEVAIAVDTLDGQQLFQNKALQKLKKDSGAGHEYLQQLISHNLEKLRCGDKAAITGSHIFPAQKKANESDPGELSSHLVVRSKLPPAGGDTAISFVYLRLGDSVAPLDQTPLSHRERQIVTWVGAGMTNRQIADRAFISENTVREHLKRVFGKLNVRSRAHLIQAVWQSGC